MKKNLLIVKKFVEKKKGCDAYSTELYSELLECQMHIHRATLKSLTKKQFDIAMLKVCKQKDGKVVYLTKKDKVNNNRKYVIVIKHT